MFEHSVGRKDILQFRQIHRSNIGNDKTLREVLESLRIDLLSEKKSLEERIAQIELVLSEDKVILDEDICDSPSFQMITEILKPEQIENYAKPVRNSSINSENCLAFWMTFSGERITRIPSEH